MALLGDELTELGAWTAAPDESERIAGAVRAARELVGDSLIAAVSAVGQERRQVAAVALLEGLGLDVAVQPDAGLDLRIDFPETCGMDRKLAARGALDSERTLDRSHLIVVDAGTALTVDACLRLGNGSGWRGAFLGGAIALGPTGMATAVAEIGARLPAFGVSPEADALGRSTELALQSGVTVGFRGVVRELATSIAREAFDAAIGQEIEGPGHDVACHLTGGARDFARGPLLELFGDALHEDARLVHRGLGAAGRDLLHR